MKKFYLLAVMAIVAVSCDREKEIIDPAKDPVTEDVEQTEPGQDIKDDATQSIEDFLKEYTQPVDGKAVVEALTSNGFRYDLFYEFRFDRWFYPWDARGGMNEGFFIKDNIIHYVCWTGFGPNGEAPVMYTRDYEFIFDEESATIFTKSKQPDRDFTFTAKVLYFKDDLIVIDGVLGSDDYMNEDYATRRIVYTCIVDNELAAEWMEQLAK